MSTMYMYVYTLCSYHPDIWIVSKTCLTQDRKFLQHEETLLSTFLMKITHENIKFHGLVPMKLNFSYETPSWNKDINPFLKCYFDSIAFISGHFHNIFSSRFYWIFIEFHGYHPMKMTFSWIFHKFLLQILVMYVNGHDPVTSSSSL